MSVVVEAVFGLGLLPSAVWFYRTIGLPVQLSVLVSPLDGQKKRGDDKKRYNGYDDVAGKRTRTFKPGLPVPVDLRCARARDAKLTKILKAVRFNSEACMGDIVEHLAAESNVRMKLRLRDWRFGKRAAHRKTISGLRKTSSS